MRKRDQLESLPIFKKAETILKLIMGLVELVDEEDEFLSSTKHLMVDDAIIICSKIAGAEGGNLYSIRMQNAAIIRDHAMHMHTQVGSLRIHKSFKEKEYISLIRKEIDEFRELFIQWVASFDKSNYIWDEWELFNPPGAIPPNPNDYQDPINWDDFMNNINPEDFEDDNED